MRPSSACSTAARAWSGRSSPSSRSCSSRSTRSRTGRPTTESNAGPCRQPADRVRLEQALFARSPRAGRWPRANAGPLGDNPDVAPALRVLDRPDWEQLAERVNLPPELIAQLRKAAGPHSLAVSSYPEKFQRSIRLSARGFSRIWRRLVHPGLTAVVAGFFVWALGQRDTVIEVAGHPHHPGRPGRTAAARVAVGPRGGETGRRLSNEPEAAIGLAAAQAGGENRGRPEPVRVRQNFPETLLWRPELITDDQGHARLDVDLADSITTWRVAIGAVSADGSLGAAQAAIRVFQPFFVDLDLPTALTRGDEIGIPVVVSNYLDKPQAVTLALAGSPLVRRGWSRPASSRSSSSRTRSARRTSASGPRRSATTDLEVTARGSERGPGRRRPPAHRGRPRRPARRAGRLGHAPAPGRGRRWPPPSTPFPGSVRAIVKIYPSSFSQLVEGLDAIFQRPFGCFEQTSSTTYPNVLALDYLRRTRRASPRSRPRPGSISTSAISGCSSFEIAGRRLRLVRPSARQPHADGLRPDGVRGHGAGCTTSIPT